MIALWTEPLYCVNRSLLYYKYSMREFIWHGYVCRHDCNAAGLRTATASKLGFSACSFFAVSHQYNKHLLFRHVNGSSIVMGSTDVAQVCSGFVEVRGLITLHGSWSSLVSLLTVSKSGFALIVYGRLNSKPARRNGQSTVCML